MFPSIGPCGQMQLEGERSPDEHTNIRSAFLRGNVCCFVLLPPSISPTLSVLFCYSHPISVALISCARFLSLPPSLCCRFVPSFLRTPRENQPTERNKTKKHRTTNKQKFRRSKTKNEPKKLWNRHVAFGGGGGNIVRRRRELVQHRRLRDHPVAGVAGSSQVVRCTIFVCIDSISGSCSCSLFVSSCC